MLKSSLLFFAVALLTVVCLPIAGRNPQAASPAQTAETGKNPVKPTAESRAKAKEIYHRDCALCHGENGNGKTDLATGMNLALDDWTNPGKLANKADSDLFAAIRNGKGDHMPAEDVGRANDTEVWNLILYIRAFPSKAQPPASAPAAPDAAPAPAPPAQ
ncbi:MAG: cytochrome c [Terracidiphilus sp.]|jgi:mono/diheme cytochrome c family protein